MLFSCFSAILHMDELKLETKQNLRVSFSNGVQIQKIVWKYLWKLHLFFLGNHGDSICSADFAVEFNTKKELFTWPVHKTQYK